MILIIIAGLILLIQLIYIITFLFAFRKDQAAGATLEQPVSVIVCAHDEEGNLRKLVPALLAQAYGQFELIIVEDRSNDGTYDYLLDVTSRDPRVKMVRVEHLPEHLNGKKYALTLGIRAATHDWVLLTDADCMPATENWIKSMTSQFAEGREIAIGYSPYIKSAGWLNSFIRFESLITGIQFMGWGLLGRPYMGVGRNLAYRKSLFMSSKGFNKHLAVTGGDDDLFVNDHATRSNTAVSIGRDTLTYSEPKKTAREYFYQKLRHLAAGKRYRPGDKWRLGLFTSTWVLTWLAVIPALFLFLPDSRWIYVGAGWVIREILLITLVHRVSGKLGDPFESWKTPLLDFNYAIYYLGTGLVALKSKRVRWKI